MYVPLFLEICLIFSHEILYRCLWHYSDGNYTKKFYSHHLLFSWGPFWGIFRPVVSVYVCSSISWEPFSIFSWNFLQMFLVLLWQSLHEKINFPVIPLSLLGAILKYFGDNLGYFGGYFENFLVKFDIDILGWFYFK